MAETKGMNFQDVQKEALPLLGAPERTDNETLFERIQSELARPLRAYASFPTADSRLNFSAAISLAADGAAKLAPPINNISSEYPASYIDFQTQTTNGGDFVIDWPASTVGQFRVAAFALNSADQIQVVFSEEEVDILDLVDPAALLPQGTVQIGWIYLECTDVSGLFKTAGSATSIIENSVGGEPRIFRLEIGGGAGGSGDANEDNNRFYERFSLSDYGRVYTNIARIDQADYLDVSSTAGYDLLSQTFKFNANAVEVLISSQILSDAFLDQETDVEKVELYGIWSLPNIDTDATYEVSRDGGAHWTEIETSRIGDTDAVFGEAILEEEAANSYEQEYDVSNADDIVELDDSSNQKISRAVSFVNTVVLKKLTIYLEKLDSLATGYAYVSLVRDNSGEPSEDIEDTIVTGLPIAISNLSVGNNIVEIPMYCVAKAGLYHIVISTSNSYKDTYTGNNDYAIAVRVDSSSGPTPNIQVFDGASWSAEVADTTMPYILEGRELDVRVRITSSNTPEEKLLKSFALYYDLGLKGDFTPLDNIIPPTSDVATDINWESGLTFYRDLASSSSVTFSNPVDGKTIVVDVENKTAGDLTIDFPVGILWPGGVPVTAVLANSHTVYTFLYAAGKFFATGITGFQ